MDPGIARLAKYFPCMTRRWLGESASFTPPDYSFFPWKGQRIDSPAGAVWTSDDDVRAITPPSPPPLYVYSDGVPPVYGYGAGTYNLGGLFVTTAPGKIVTMRFWKVVQDTGPHIGNIWRSSDQSLLSQVTFSNETASGWQTAPLSAPVPIVAGEVYRVACTHTIYIAYYIGSPAFTNPPLTMQPGGCLVDGSAVLYPLSTGGDSYGTDIGYIP